MTTATEWRGRVGEEWARHVTALDRMLGPSTDIGIARLDPRPGERILDIGCGAGRSCLALAEAVGTQGNVIGVDISEALLDAARARRDAAGFTQIELRQEDAGIARFAPGGCDAMFSAFGTKFFDDPVAALANIRRALKPGGRAVMLAWREMPANLWARIGVETGRDLLGPPPEAPSGGPGPFAWASPRQFEPILAQAGFSEIMWQEAPSRPEIALGDDRDPVTRAAAFLLRIGPLAARLRQAPAEMRAEAEAALRPRLAPHVQGGSVRLDASAWVIEARNPVSPS